MNSQFELIKSSGGIDEYRLKSNDLRVLMLQDLSTPVATFMVTYHVGSRNEAIGYTGSTHLLEHLMFKGSRNYNKENGTAIWDELQSIGAQINATTWNDRTNYFEVVPSEHIEKAISIEADRMRFSFLRDEDRQPEMTVVRNEYERGENSPFDVLDKNIWATAYQAHPYHHSTIGWRSDIENVSTQRLKEFYDTYYWPNNATVTIIGDIDKEDALNLVNKYFGEHSKSTHDIPDMYTEEPDQEGERRVTVNRKGQTDIVAIAHKTPPGLSSDTYAFHLLSKIFADGKSSRLHKALIDPGLATSLFMYDFPFKDNGLFITYAFLNPGENHKNIEDIILSNYSDIIENGVTNDEINRAKAQTKATVAFSRDGSYSVASAINEALAIGDWTFYTTFLEKINSVSKKEIMEIAQNYLIDKHKTTGWFISSNNGNI